MKLTSRIAVALFSVSASPAPGFSAFEATPKPHAVAVDFGTAIRTWDGFGLNYIEAGHTNDPVKDYEDYGGFSRLSETQRQKVMDLLHGSLDSSKPDEGLQIGLHKIFLEPHHQSALDAPFVGASASTPMTRYFLQETLKRRKARGAGLEIVTTYYGAPAWATARILPHWRDPHPERLTALAGYMANWVEFLRSDMIGATYAPTARVRYVSVTNEGEDFTRWNDDGSVKPGKDYNLYWSSKKLAAFLPVLRTELDRQGLSDLGIMPCETSGWDGLEEAHGDKIAATLLADPQAMKSIGIIGGHSFGASGDPGARAVAAFREKLGPQLRAWTTSHDWRKGDTASIESIRSQIYLIGVTGVITWAATKLPSEWQRYTGRPPNEQCCVLVKADGTFVIQSGYYFYKQVSRAGQPGMSVATVKHGTQGSIRLIAFGRNGTIHRDAFVVINTGKTSAASEIVLQGTSATRWSPFRTRDALAEGEAFKPLGEMTGEPGGILRYDAPPKSVTTFFAQ